MSTPIFSPNPISLVTVEGGESTVNSVQDGTISADGTVTPSFADNSKSAASVVLTSWEWEWQEGEGAHGPVKIKVPVQVSQAPYPQPLSVSSGQYIQVEAQFKPISGTPSASESTLSLASNSWPGPATIHIEAKLCELVFKPALPLPKALESDTRFGVTAFLGGKADVTEVYLHLRLAQGGAGSSVSFASFDKSSEPQTSTQLKTEIAAPVYFTLYTSFGFGIHGKWVWDLDVQAFQNALLSTYKLIIEA